MPSGYIGYEVLCQLEGVTENEILSEKTYLTVLIDGQINEHFAEKMEDDLLLSEHVNNQFEWSNDFNVSPFQIKYVDYIENVTEGLVLDDKGNRYLKIVEVGDGTRHDHYIKEGEMIFITFYLH